MPPKSTRVAYPPVSLAVADAIVEELKQRLRFSGVKRVVIAVGSTRRRRAQIDDIDLLVMTNSATPFAAVSLAPSPTGIIKLDKVLAKGDRNCFLSARRGKQRFNLDLFATRASEKPFALFHRTGSKGYNIRTRAHAKKKGWILNQYGLFSAATKKRVPGSSAVKTERDLVGLLGLHYHPPAERDD